MAVIVIVTMLACAAMFRLHEGRSGPGPLAALVLGLSLLMFVLMWVLSGSSAPVPGTYYVDEVDGTPTPRILVTIGTGWTRHMYGSGLNKDGDRRNYSPKDDVGFITFSRPAQVYSDACHLSDGFHPGPVTTVDGLVTALSEQRGWADVTVPVDISIDGYRGKSFHRAAPAVLSDCPNMSPGHMRIPALGGDALRSWLNERESNLGGWYDEPGQSETLVVLDIDGTVVVINANVWPGTSAAARAEFDAVLDSIRIERP